MKLQEIGQTVEGLQQVCQCDAPIKAAQIECHTYSAGVNVDGFSTYQWVYFQCEICGNDTSLRKILNMTEGVWTLGREIPILMEMILIADKIPEGFVARASILKAKAKSIPAQDVKNWAEERPA